MTPRVAVIIPAHNVAEYLPAALASVAAQTMRDFECVVVDDGSTDCVSHAWVEGVPRAEVDGGRFRIYEQPYEGLACAVGTGAAVTVAPRLMSMGGDDLLDPDYLQRCCDALDANPASPCAYGRVKEFGTRTEYWIPGGYVPGQLATRALIPGCAVWRRAVWDLLGGFDVRFDRGLEDWHLAARAEVAGILSRATPPAFAPDALYLHRARGDSLTDTMTPEYRAWAEREIATLFEPAAGVVP